jgi:hypothetical protein
MACPKGFDNLRFDKDKTSLDGFLPSAKGRFFLASDKRSKEVEYWDSRSLSVCHVGVDTVKQLYKGMVKKELFDFVSNAYDMNTPRLSIGGYTWKLGSGRWGGYRFSLNNPDLGILVLFGSFYTSEKYEGDHLKIEVSPHFILNKNLTDLQDCIDDFADIFIHMRQYTGVAVHLCVDVQGWQPAVDLDCTLVTRASKVRKYSGQSEMAFERHAIATVYGQGETFTFGGVGSLQFSVYNKSKLIAKNQNVQAYWHTVYSARCIVDGVDADLNVPFDGDDSYQPVFKKEVDVWRIEARFHHSVIAQFALGLNQDLRSFKALGKHLTGLWRYSLNNFRYDASPTYIHPVWQFLRDDIVFNHDDNALIYKRIYKKTDFDMPPSHRVLKILFGLLCSCYRRLKYDFDTAYDYLCQSGVYNALAEMYMSINDWDWDYDANCAEADIRELLLLKLCPLEPLAFES